MITKIIEKLSLPDTLLTAALLETVMILLAVLIAGFLINTVNTVLTNLVAAVTGEIPAFILRNYLTYPGTVHHELSHALIAFITGGRILKIRLLPKGKQLGSVEFEPRGNLFTRSLQLSLTAMAPVVLGVISLVLMWRFVLPSIGEIWQYILFWYFFISIFFHMSMSDADYLNFLKGLIPSAVIIFLIFLIIGAAGFVL